MNCPVCQTTADTLNTVLMSNIRRIWSRRIGLRVQDTTYNTMQFNECPRCTYQFFNKPLVGDERFYDLLTVLTKYYIFPEDKEEFKYIGSRVTSKDVVLDIGCGNGNLFKHVKHARWYTGIDFSIMGCYLQQTTSSRKHIVNTSLEAFSSISKEMYSMVVMSHVLEHVENPKLFAQQAVSQLMRGGELIVTVPNHDSYLYYACNSVFNLPPNHVGRWTRRSLFELFEKQLGLHYVGTFVEPLQSVHRQDYAEAFLGSLGFSFIPPPCSSSVWYSICHYLAKIVKHVVRAHVGHSITLTFRKNDE